MRDSFARHKTARYFPFLHIFFSFYAKLAKLWQNQDVLKFGTSPFYIYRGSFTVLEQRNPQLWALWEGFRLRSQQIQQTQR